MVSLRLSEQGNVMAVPEEPVRVHSLEEVGRRGNKKEGCTVLQGKGQAQRWCSHGVASGEMRKMAGSCLAGERVLDAASILRALVPWGPWGTEQ